MPESDFFSFRYAIPGYSFILLVIAINFVPLIKILEGTQVESVFGAFLAFLSLFAGSAIGFIISQFWYIWFKRSGGLFWIPGFESVENVLFEECERRAPSIRIPRTAIDVAAVFDFINHQKRNDELLKLAQRRWDLYHALSATRLALVIGTALGIGCRIYYQVFLFNTSSSLHFGEFLAIVFILICVGVLLWAVCEAIRISMTEYRPLLEAIIRTSEFNEKQLEEAFPNYFPTKNQSKARPS